MKFYAAFVRNYTQLTKPHNSFRRLRSHLSNGLVVHRTKQFAHRINLLCAAAQTDQPSTFTVGVVLTAFLIKYQSAVTLREAGELEQVLLGAAHDLVNCIDSILTHLVTTGSFSSMSRDLAKSFPVLLTLYLDAYKLWHVVDQARIAIRVKIMLKALYHAEKEIPSFDTEDSRLRTAFRLQVTQLRAILGRVSGEDSLDRFDAEIMGEMNDVVDGLINVLNIAQNGDAGAV